MDPNTKSFEFRSYSINSEKTEAQFSYSIHFENTESLHFVEKIFFDKKDQRTDISDDVLNRILHALHIICGVNYWKLYCPKEIIVSTKPLSKEMAQFWNEVYLKGLGEFYYRNNLPLSVAPQFPHTDIEYQYLTIQTQDRSLLGIGGGKDSLLAYEMLKEKNGDVTGLVIETQKSHPVLEHVLSAMEVSALKVRRVLDPLLFEQNSLDYTYNGHIPISAIFAFIGVLTAYLYDYKYIIVGNEQSANSENVQLDGVNINHQWSKSAEFENAFQQYVKSFIISDIMYFSLLRPYYEIKIVEKFSQYKKYFHLFSSCNTNFKIQEKNNHGGLWCGECAKCAFIFSLFTAFLPKSEVLEIFGKNLYADEKLIEIFQELLGVKGIKPFDCVGTKEEVKVAMNRAFKTGEYNEDVAIKMFENEVLARHENLDILEKEVMEVQDTSLIPEKFKTLV